MSQGKQIHTHRGHCQLCAAVQAIDTQTGLIAEHGYTVKGGYFSGSCPGSRVMNLHVDRKTADDHIARAREEMGVARATADRFEAHIGHPKFSWNGEHRMVRDVFKLWEMTTHDGASYCPLAKEKVLVKWAEASTEYQEISRHREINRLRERAIACERYANTLEAWANRITGKVDPYEVRDLEPREHAVGDTVTIGGKTGWTAVIEAIEDQKYTTFGFRRGRGTVMCKHARLTRPAITEKRVSEKAGGYVSREARLAKVFWVALRDIKRPPNPLAEELRKEGLL